MAKDQERVGGNTCNAPEPNWQPQVGHFERWKTSNKSGESFVAVMTALRTCIGRFSMNRNKLKQYAPQARRDFIAAVTDRAAHYGMTRGNIEPITEQGEVALLGGTPFPRSIAAKRKRLEERINRSQTLSYNKGELEKIPLPIETQTLSDKQAFQAINIAKSDWDSYETSWDFTSFPLLQSDFLQPTLKATYAQIRSHWQEMTLEMNYIEEDNNFIFIEYYGLQEELTSEVPFNEIIITCNPHYRYGGNKSNEEMEEKLLEYTMNELISYAIGSMMGRYNLDKPGLIYAHSGNQGFNSSQYQTFPADDDGIVPITDDDWFPDDGVKVNYGKFGDLLAEVKAVTGGTDRP